MIARRARDLATQNPRSGLTWPLPGELRTMKNLFFEPRGRSRSKMTTMQGTFRLRPFGKTLCQAGLIMSIGLLLLMPVWMVRYPPLVDYPNHLARYFILGHLQDPNLRLSQFYESRWEASPYVAVDVLAVSLQKLLPIDIVGRLILSISLIGLPLASYVFLRQVSHESRYLAAWALVIAHGPVFLVGFVNVALSAALCFFLLTLWLNCLTKPGWRLWIGSLTLATLLYLTHLVGFAIAAIVVLAYCVWTRQTIGHLWISTSIFVPGVLLYLLAFIRGKSYWLMEANPTYEYQLGIGDKLRLLVSPFRGYSHYGTVLVVVALISCLILAVWRNRDIRLNHPWLRVACTMFVVYLLSPANFHFLDIRIVPFLFILGMSVAKVGRRARILGAIGLLAFSFHSFDVNHTFISRQEELERWHRSFEAIPPIPEFFRLCPKVRENGSAATTYIFGHMGLLNEDGSRQTCSIRLGFIPWLCARPPMT